MKKVPKLYLARAGRNGEDEDLALKNNLAIITHSPWNRSGDTLRYDCGTTVTSRATAYKTTVPSISYCDSHH